MGRITSAPSLISNCADLFLDWLLAGFQRQEDSPGYRRQNRCRPGSTKCPSHRPSKRYCLRWCSFYTDKIGRQDGDTLRAVHYRYGNIHHTMRPAMKKQKREVSITHPGESFARDSRGRGERSSMTSSPAGPGDVFEESRGK